MSPGVFLNFFLKKYIVNIKIPTFFLLVHFNSVFRKWLFFKFINKCQTEICNFFPIFAKSFTLEECPQYRVFNGFDSYTSTDHFLKRYFDFKHKQTNLWTPCRPKCSFFLHIFSKFCTKSSFQGAKPSIWQLLCPMNLCYSKSIDAAY